MTTTNDYTYPYLQKACVTDVKKYHFFRNMFLENSFTHLFLTGRYHITSEIWQALVREWFRLGPVDPFPPQYVSIHPRESTCANSSAVIRKIQDVVLEDHVPQIMRPDGHVTNFRVVVIEAIEKLGDAQSHLKKMLEVQTRGILFILTSENRDSCDSAVWSRTIRVLLNEPPKEFVLAELERFGVMQESHRTYLFECFGTDLAACESMALVAPFPAQHVPFVDAMLARDLPQMHATTLAMTFVDVLRWSQTLVDLHPSPHFLFCYPIVPPFVHPSFWGFWSLLVRLRAEATHLLKGAGPPFPILVSFFTKLKALTIKWEENQNRRQISPIGKEHTSTSR